MRFIKRHAILFAVLGFLLLTLPSAVDTYWSLIEKLQEVNMPSLSLGVLDRLLPLTGLVLFVIVLWQIRKSRVGMTDQQILTSTKLSQKLTHEQAAERLAFIRHLQSVAEQLVKNSQGAETLSIFSIFDGICREPQVREYIEGDGLAKQASRILKKQLEGLVDRVSRHQKQTEELTTDLSDDDIHSFCNTTNRLVLDYRQLVDEVLEMLNNLAQKGVPALWDSAPWSVRIHRSLADNYDEVMRLVADLKMATPRFARDLLPKNNQLSKFPRASLLA